VKNKKQIADRMKLWYCKNRKKLLKNSNEYQKIYRLNNRELLRQKGIVNNLKYNYKITMNDYNTLLKNQNNVCKICKQKETAKYKGKLRKLSVDHCHKTGKIRGILCMKCNRGIGYFNDNILLFKNVIKYLKRNLT
jgi:hypothetical protein